MLKVVVIGYVMKKANSVFAGEKLKKHPIIINRKEYLGVQEGRPEIITEKLE